MKKFIKGIAIAALAALTVSALAACGADKQASTGDSSAAQKTETKSADGVITFGTNAEFPPFEFVSAKGGLTVSILQSQRILPKATEKKRKSTIWNLTLCSLLFRTDSSMRLSQV